MYRVRQDMPTVACASSCANGTKGAIVMFAEVLRQGISDAVSFALWDPRAVREAMATGVGSDITLSLGGKTPMAALNEASHPVAVSGHVKLAFDGRYKNRGPMSARVLADLGPTVVIDTGAVVISFDQEPFDLNCLSSVGVDPRQKRFILLKSRIHWRAGFGDLADEVIECQGLGVTTSDYSKLKFSKVRRPIYPLDGAFDRQRERDGTGLRDPNTSTSPMRSTPH